MQVLRALLLADGLIWCRSHSQSCSPLRDEEAAAIHMPVVPTLLKAIDSASVTVTAITLIETR